MQKRKPTAVKQASALLIALTTAFLLVACGGDSSAPADAVLSDSSEATKTSEAVKTSETAKKNAEAVKKAEEAKKESDEKKECKVAKEARKKKSGSDSRREDDDEREDDDRDDDKDEVKTCTPTPPGGGTPSPNAIAQTITFNAPMSATVGVSSTLSATASSGLAVSFASSTKSICTVSGMTITYAMPGSCTVTASQGGNSGFLAATPVPQTFTVVAAPGSPAPTPVPSAANGKLLYSGSIASSCVGCHGAMANMQNVQKAANNPNVIQNAITGNKGGMGSYYKANTFTSAQLADMAAFIAAPF